MATSLNIRLNDEVECKLKKALKHYPNDEATASEVVREAIIEYADSLEAIEKGFYTIKLPISQFKKNELEELSKSLSYIHQMLLDRDLRADYVEDLDLDKDNKMNDDDIEKCFNDITRTLVYIAKLKRNQD